MREPVALVLGLADVGSRSRLSGQRVEQLDEQARDLARVGGRLREEVEELALLGVRRSRATGGVTTSFHFVTDQPCAKLPAAATELEAPTGTTSRGPASTPAARSIVERLAPRLVLAVAEAGLLQALLREPLEARQIGAAGAVVRAHAAVVARSEDSLPVGRERHVREPIGRPRR